MGLGGQRQAPAALPPGKNRYPLYRRLDGPQGRSGWVRETSPPPGFDFWTVQPVASRYTNWSIPAPLLISKADKPPPAHKSLLYFKMQWVHTTKKFATQIIGIVEWTLAASKIWSEENFCCASWSKLLLGWQLEEFEIFRFCLIACQLHAPVSHVVDVVQAAYEIRHGNQEFKTIIVNRHYTEGWNIGGR
jgi:hypothetical protein